MSTYGPGYSEITRFDDMLGKTIERIDGKVGGERLEFLLSDGSGWVFFHSQDCCESVEIQDIVGDLTDLCGSPITEAEEISSKDAAPPQRDYAPESYTWTFYRFSTAKGTVTVRWLGESNGYYSESVTFAPIGGAR